MMLDYLGSSTNLLKLILIPSLFLQIRKTSLRLKDKNITAVSLIILVELIPNTWEASLLWLNQVKYIIPVKNAILKMV